MKNILILCTGNSCRSQIAHGYFAHFGKQNLKVYSAGIETHGVNPKAIANGGWRNRHSGYSSNHVDEYLHIPFDYILTVCDHAQENCPSFRVRQPFGFIITLQIPPSWFQKTRKKSKLHLLRLETKSKGLLMPLWSNIKSGVSASPIA